MSSNSHETIEHLEPRVLLAAQAYDWKAATMKGDGFIDGIVYSPAAPNVVYIHTDMGGAYRYDTATSKWAPLNDWSQWNDWSPQNLGVETMAVDPTDANRVYMAAGTYNSPTAILRSTDQGRTWLRTDVSGINSNGNGSARNAGERMMVDPNSPNILYYGTRNDGLWKSINYGVTWNNVASFPTTGEQSSYTADTGIVWVLFDKSSASAGNSTQTIYAGVVVRTAGLTRIYRSTDGGASWAALPGGQPTPAESFPQRAALTPDGSALYITYGTSTASNGYPGPYGIVEGFVEKVAAPSSVSPTWIDISPPVTYGFSAATLDPANSNTIYVSELGDYNPADRIWKSTTGGSSWTVISPNSNRDNSSAAYANSLNVHWMGDVEIDPFNNNVAMFTTGFGLYRTTNFQSANPTWSFFNNGFEQSAVLEINSPNTGSVNLIDAIGDRDGFRHDSLDQSPSIGRLGQASGIAEGTSDDIDTAFNDANYAVRVVRVSPYVQYSLDNGQHWSWFPSTYGSTNGGGQIAISADGLFAAYDPSGSNRTRFSTRTGSTWSAWTAPASSQPANNSRIIADLSAAHTFYAYAGTTVSRSTDGGVNWTVMTTTAPASFNWIRAVPGQAGHLVAENGSLYRSVNGGATWTQINTITTANQVGVGAGPTPGAYPSIYIGGTVGGQPGFFRSDDQGATWTMISDLAHQFGYVTVIQGDPRVYGRLYVGTNGRGVQYGDIHPIPASFPMLWNTQDIGSPGSAGAASGSSGSFELIGGGAGVGGTSDQFRYAHTTLAGDGQVTARVVTNPSTSPANNNAKAGVMIRNDLTSGSAETFMAMTPGSVNGAVFQSRLSSGGSTATVNNTGVWNPYWVRLTRTGSNFVAERSGDGSTWVQVGATQSIAMNATVYVGLAVTTSDNNFLNIATFDNVSVNATATPVSITGTAAADTIRLVRNGALTEAWVNGSIQASFDPTTTSGLNVIALAGDDTLTLDFTNGNPLPTNATIDGGVDSDTLAVVGTPGADVATFNASSVSLTGAIAQQTGVEAYSFDGAGGADDVTVNSGAVVTFPVTQHLNSLTIGGSVVAAPNASSGLGIRTDALSITGSGTLDLTNNDLILGYSAKSPLTTVEGMIGTRLISSSIGTPAASTLGAMESSEYRGLWGSNAPFDGESIADPAVLVKFTYNGDTDFSGTVNFDDYVRIDIGFNSALTGWVNGDFNRTGSINFDDYVAIDLGFNLQTVVL